MQKIYHREAYLQRIRPFYHDDGLIKVITGVRRCGKSCLLLSIQDELLQLGVAEQNIIFLNLDKRGYRNIKTGSQLDELIESRVKGVATSAKDGRTDKTVRNGLTYLFIDEVQNVTDFEEVINAWREEGGLSIFITGSNSYLLSGELVTKLTGRYLEFPLYTLSFAEYLGMMAFLGKTPPIQQNLFEEYLRYGGFPKTLEYNDAGSRQAYVREVVAQIVKKDVRAHRKVRNVEVFDKALSYIVGNFGATISIQNVVDHFTKTEHIPLSRATVKRYLDLLENAKLIERCPRFDIKSRRSLSIGEKYYLSDLGIYFATNVDNRINYGPALENVLFNHLRSKGYSVSVGRIGKLECDFIVRKGSEYAYVQVALSIVDPVTEEREYRPFRYIRDSWPCYLFTLDPLQSQRDGVKHINLVEFLEADGDLL